MTLKDGPAPQVRPDRYFEADTDEEATLIRQFGAGAMAAFCGNLRQGVPAYLIVGGTMLGLAEFLVATVKTTAPESATDELYEGIVRTFERLIKLERAKRVIEQEAGVTRQ
jgi:hypothetical protein